MARPTGSTAPTRSPNTEVPDGSGHTPAPGDADQSKVMPVRGARFVVKPADTSANATRLAIQLQLLDSAGPALGSGFSVQSNTADLFAGLPASATLPSGGFASYAIAPLAANQPVGTTGITRYTFIVTRSGDPTAAATLNYAVAGTGKSPASASLFANPTGTIAFPAQATSATITVNVNGASITSAKTFAVTLSGPLGTVISAPTAIGTITSNNFVAVHTKTLVAEVVAGDIYAGPVAGLNFQYVSTTADNLAVTSSTPNTFIHTGSGDDAIDVSHANGNNVLDGSTGSNFLVGGTGSDTFFLDDRRATTDVFSTVVNFRSGDDATVWGVTPADFKLTISDNQGAAGFKGLDFAFTAPGKPNANLVLAGFSTSDLTSGRLTTNFGTTQTTGFVAGSVYMLIHAN